MGPVGRYWGSATTRLRRITVPTAIVPFKGRCHPRTSAEHAQQTIPDGRFFDLDGESGQLSSEQVAVAEIFCDFAGTMS